MYEIEKTFLHKLFWSFEARYFDRIDMTEKRLEYDRKKITTTNMTDWTWPKHYTDEHERLNMTEIPMKMTEIYI